MGGTHNSFDRYIVMYEKGRELKCSEEAMHESPTCGLSPN